MNKYTKLSKKVDSLDARLMTIYNEVDKINSEMRIIYIKLDKLDKMEA